MSKVANSFFTRFNPPPSPVVVAKGGLAQQHFKDECDLNNVLKHYARTGIPGPSSPGVFADLTAIPKSLDEAFDAVAGAVDWFSDLPSDVREKFGNDPRQALRLLYTDVAAAIAAGLLPADAKPIIEKASEEAPPEPPKEAAKPEPAKA